MTSPTTVLLVCGSVRAGSTTAAALATARAEAPAGTRATPFDGLLDLPHFDPDADAEGMQVHPAVASWREALAGADAVLLATPEYAGDMPGLLKEALEWTIGAASLDRKPVAWVNASTNPSRAADAHRSLDLVLRWAGAHVVEAACAHVPVPRTAVGPDGTVAEPRARAAIAASFAALVAA